MEYQLEFSERRVTMTTSGRVEIADVERLVDELVSDPRFTPGMPMLADHRNVDARALGPEEMRRIGYIFAARSDALGPSPLAILVGDSLTFGLSRMGIAYGRAAPLRPRLFYSQADAEAWLEQQAERAAR